MRDFNIYTNVGHREVWGSTPAGITSFIYIYIYMHVDITIAVLIASIFNVLIWFNSVDRTEL